MLVVFWYRERYSQNVFWEETFPFTCKAKGKPLLKVAEPDWLCDFTIIVWHKWASCPRAAGLQAHHKRDAQRNHSFSAPTMTMWVPDGKGQFCPLCCLPEHLTLSSRCFFILSGSAAKVNQLIDFPALKKNKKQTSTWPLPFLPIIWLLQWQCTTLPLKSPLNRL